MRSYDQAFGGYTQLHKLRSGDLHFHVVFLRTPIPFRKIQSFEIESPSFGTLRPLWVKLSLLYSAFLLKTIPVPKMKFLDNVIVV